MIPAAFLGVHDLPLVNAILNGTATILLLVGYGLIRSRRDDAHHWVMWAAFLVSCLFLISYLTYHAQVGSVRFDKPGWVRTVYLWILAPHTILAAIVPFLAVITLVWAQQGRFRKHRALARWTLPIWLYVSVTGVVVYLLLYQVRPRL
jgi:putative membrane protein